MMRRLTNFKLALIALLTMVFMPIVSATEGMGAGGVASLTGPLNILVSLGIETIPSVSIQQAQLCYRWISICAIMWVALTADKKSSTIFCVLAVIVSACTAAAGWFTTVLPDGTINPAGPWGLIILCALLTVVSYMTETKKANFGINGAGDPIINIFVFMIILQATIGLLNGAAIFPAGTGVATPGVCTGDNFGHCSLDGASKLENLQTNTITGNSNTGILNTMYNFATGAAAMGWGAILLVVQIAISLAFVGIVITTTYPWITQSTIALAALGIFQLMVWCLYVLTLARWMGKTSIGEMRL
ncbi:MAG: hypothetical protein WC998_04100 [Candidatus Paceibacterota bacterium]|jgi:hypothetical protein